MHIERFDPVTDTEKIRVCHELHVAAQPLDDPDVPAESLPVFTGGFSRGWDADPREAWLAREDGARTWAGGYLLALPQHENRHSAWLNLFVAPDRRRHGIGAELLRHAAARAAEHGRTQLTNDTREGSAGAAFAVAAGSDRGITEVRRVVDLADQPAGYLDPLRQRAAAASAGYSAVSWLGPCPEEYLDGVVSAVNAMADAPLNQNEEPEVATPRRIRKSEEYDDITGVRGYSVAARCDETGEFAGMTRVVVDPLRPAWGWQQLTAVVRAHRGHRLGLLVKVAMMDWLARTEPQLEHILTGNSATNRYMIAINADLGYRVLDEWPSWQLDVAKALTFHEPHPATSTQLR